MKVRLKQAVSDGQAVELTFVNAQDEEIVLITHSSQAEWDYTPEIGLLRMNTSVKAK